MKKQLLLLAVFALCGNFGYAQEVPSEEWTIFNPSTGETNTTQVLDAEAAAIVGDDDRKEVTGQAPVEERAVVVLEMVDQGQRFLCSGSMVGKNVVLTAAHCLTEKDHFVEQVNVYAVGMPGAGGENPGQPSAENPSEDTTKLLIEYLNNHGKKDKKKKKTWPFLKDKLSAQQTADHDQPRPNTSQEQKNASYPGAKGKTFWVPSKWLELTKNKKDDSYDVNKEASYDYGIMVLDRPLGDQTGWMQLSVETKKSLQNASIVVIGRPGDKPSRSLWEAKGKIGYIADRYFYHSADQVGGNSGGPIVFPSNRGRIVGLANFGDRRKRVSGGDANGGLRITNVIVNAVHEAVKNAN